MGVHIRALAPVASTGGGGSGTVTSVSLSLPGSVFSTSGSPITASGTLSGSFLNQSSATIFGGPTTGAPAVPLFRSLVSTDLPSVNLATTGNGGVSGVLPIINGGTNASVAFTAFNNLSPMSSSGDIIIGSTAGAALRLGIGTTNQVLTVSGGLPSWQASQGGGTTNLATSGAGGVTGTLPLVNMAVFPVVNITANTTLSSQNIYTITSTSAYLLSLPAPLVTTSFYLKDISGSLGTNNTTLQATSAGTTGNIKIEGSTANKILQTNYGGWFYFADGTSWWQI